MAKLNSDPVYFVGYVSRFDGNPDVLTFDSEEAARRAARERRLGACKPALLFKLTYQGDTKGLNVYCNLERLEDEWD